ncbi:PPOX class F420-dependent enzyme [Actinoplanes sp. NBRC 14428]|uniref:PPOX class probable F420-dependent enzyme n=1 Tax=Pseudosporangium ferrugineum TaxID=439699 RepID=A0A2T0SEE7_9ACTN|nr:TIGR03618 family F420-dependent PPOX class oxidoreductase [Pseudosporangium ferrugineum]PRY31799.1 PPOX class probable F420-dependent enzyme [Pseudosporangium ferrugineum]BCJ49968.1 PPOX class F420-dependent enzyme [Actinoplanes sp. NBRC 14428]
MPTTPLPPKLTAFLRRPLPAVMATVAADGRPVTVATWYLLEDDGRILLGLDAKRARLKHLHADPRVSLTVLAPDWYSHVSVQGRAVSIADDTDLKDIDRLARHYLGEPYANRERPRMTVQVEIDRWHAWGELSEH